MLSKSTVLLVLAGSLLAGAASARAQTGENVLVVANDASDVSQAIGEYYVSRRGIPSGHLLRIHTAVDDEIARESYEHDIQGPIAGWLAAHRAQDSILYIVLTKGVPLRIRGTGGRDGTVASVDSELTLLYRRMVGRPVPIAGHVPNPYRLARWQPSSPRFTHRAADIYLVTRLDGYTLAEVKAVIDRALAPATQGRIVLDERGDAMTSPGDRWLEHAASALAALGLTHDVVLDRTTALVAPQSGVLGYYSWGSNDPAFRSRRLGMSFLPGAIAATYVSTDARTFREPPPAWTIGTWEARASYYAGSPQSLTGDLIREGVTGVAGHVAEPYLDATIRPDILFPAYFSGMNLAEAFYLAMPYLSWQSVVVGDPLCAPFQRKPLSSDEIASGVDEVSGLPEPFASQRLDVLGAHGGSRAALALVAKAEGQMMRGDRAAARASLESALKSDPDLDAAERPLAQLDDEDQRYDSAIDRYRRVLRRSPDDVVVLNNLAYLLAVRAHRPAEALGYAQRAAALAPRSADVLDTLAWTSHLAGDNARAATILGQLARSGSATPEMLIHAATVQLAGGDAAAARQSLDRAVALDAGVRTRDDVRQLDAAIARRQKSS
jgi:uncharacterized protein (TIGR03790 family)